MARKRKGSLEQSSARSAVLPRLQQSGSLLDVEALRQVMEGLGASDVTRSTWRRRDESMTLHWSQSPAPILQAAPAIAAPALRELMPVERSPQSSPAPAAHTARPEQPSRPGQLVTSPFVGTFYRTPAPDQPPFVEVGSSVRKGQV